MADGLRTRMEEIWRGRTGVRFRATAGAVLVVGIALAVAAVAMVVLLRRSLTEDVRTTARLRVEEVADFLQSGTLDRLEAGSDEQFFQIIDGRGEVVDSSDHLAGEGPLIDLPPGRDARIEVPFDDDPFLVVATSSRGPAGNYRVLAGRTLDSVVESTAAVTGLLAVGLPLLLILLAGVIWRVVGRALAPVEAIRSEVDEISTGELHRRVPLPESKDEIGRLAATMNQMLERLQAGHARQRRFVSDASHELRSPVTTIRQHAELALAHPEGASTEDLARTVLAEDLRLQLLVEDLITLARMDEHDAERIRRPVDLDDIVFEEVDRVRTVTETELDATGVSSGRILGDRRQLARLVGNLLENAVRHASSRVSVALRSNGSNVVLSVDDDGEGIPNGDRRRVFERFVRLDEARDRKSGGAGLGLAIVAEVANAHGGSAAVSDSPLGGARFEVRLPGTSE